MTNIINCKLISENIINNIKEEYDKIKFKNINKKPTIAIVQVNDKIETSIYIKNKIKALENLDFSYFIYKLNTSISNEEILSFIDILNNDTDTHGIFIELPLPVHLNEEIIINKMDYRKDIDGLHSFNAGNLVLNNRHCLFTPCTAMACMEIFNHENIDLKGKNVVIIGKSNIVGLPLSFLLLKKSSTVTVCHIDTVNLFDHTQKADILISACGCPLMIKKEHIKDDCIILDVGINVININNKIKIVGDTDFDNIKNHVNKRTPVPNGIGLITTACMLSNLLKSFQLIYS